LALLAVKEFPVAHDFVNDFEKPVGISALLFTTLTLAPSAAIQHPEADNVNISPASIYQILNEILCQFLCGVDI
jgi:hypothetical protein